LQIRFICEKSVIWIMTTHRSVRSMPEADPRTVRRADHLETFESWRPIRRGDDPGVNSEMSGSGRGGGLESYEASSDSF
jgi:hypothetical protein